MVQLLTPRRLASSRWLTPFDRFARMYSCCRSVGLGRRLAARLRNNVLNESRHQQSQLFRLLFY